MNDLEPESEIPHRYSRQVLFTPIGPEGQLRIIQSRVAVVGCGALGSFQSSLLARAGVGTLRIIDRDFVEESNLQRQVLFDEEDARLALPKAAAAEQKLKSVNSLVRIEAIVEDLNPSSADRLLSDMHLIIDGTDNFDTRYLVNDYAVKTGTPWIYGACVAAYGLTFTVLPGETACLRCILEMAPQAGISPTCDTAGIIAPIASSIASIQVGEALKILSGHRDRVFRGITSLDLWENRRDTVASPPRDPNCACCARREFPFLEGRLGSDAVRLCGRDSVQIQARSGTRIDLEQIAKRLSRLGKVETNRFLLRAFIDGLQLTLFADGRAIIGGTQDPAIAKSVYARYVGG